MYIRNCRLIICFVSLVSFASCQVSKEDIEYNVKIFIADAFKENNITATVNDVSLTHLNGNTYIGAATITKKSGKIMICDITVICDGESVVWDFNDTEDVEELMGLNNPLSRKIYEFQQSVEALNEMFE